MNVHLVRASVDDAQELHAMQVEAFRELLDRYRDYDTSPGAESLEKVKAKLSQGWTYFYFIEHEGVRVGAIRVVDAGSDDPARAKRIAPLFILPAYRKRGFGGSAVLAAEEIHGGENWFLDTILEEKGNCRLYEKLGYRKTGKATVINEKMTIIDYKK